jgi:hypothetical protein
VSLARVDEVIRCSECRTQRVVRTLVDDTGGTRTPIPEGWCFFVCAGLVPEHVTVLYYCSVECAERADDSVQRRSRGVPS